MKINLWAEFVGAALAALCLTAPIEAGAQAVVTEQQAHDIGVDAYIYFYPLVTMDITRRQTTNAEPD